MGVNSLPKPVIRQRRDCDLNPGPSVPESSTLTTRLPSHPLLPRDAMHPWKQPWACVRLCVCVCLSQVGVLLKRLNESGWFSLSPYSHTFIIGIPSPTHSFILGLNPSFSANPPYRSLSFVSFKIHYIDFPDCLLLLLRISVFLLFSFFSVFTLFQLSVPCGRLS